MPIKVQCACGKALTAKDELAGKTVKCPGCQKPLKIPAADAAKDGAKAATAPAPAKQAAKPAAKVAAKPAPARPAAAPRPEPAAAPSDSLFDEIGLAPAVEGTRPCPGCTEPLAIEALICVKCGYNTRLGRRMATVSESGGQGEGGHGAVAKDLLDRAAGVMDADAEEEKKKTHSGAPWWVFFLILIALFIFAACMLIFRSGEEPKDEKKTGWVHPAVRLVG